MRVLIIGAGIAGASLAVLLAQAGVECEVYERAAEPGGGAALAMAANGLAVLDAAGVLDALDAATIRAGMWTFENERGGLLASPWDARRGTRFQTRMVSRPILQSLLEERLRGLGVCIRYGKQLVEIDDVAGRPITAIFTDGSRAEGDCVIGADGIGSQVRRSVWPESPALGYTGLMAYVGFSPCAHPAVVMPGSEQVVHMVFGRVAFFEHVDILTPEGPQTVWWSTADAPLPQREVVKASGLGDHRARLTALHRGWSATVCDLIESAERVVPLPIFDLPDLGTWSKGRTVLVGDAAHPIGPHSGQASAMALEDAMLLSLLLVQAPAGSLAEPAALTVLFQSFEAQRRERLARVSDIGKRAAGRKQEMTAWQYWWLQQTMRIRVPLGARKPKGWLLDHRIQPAQPTARGGARG